MISLEMGAPLDMARAEHVGTGAYHMRNFISAFRAFSFERSLGTHAPNDRILMEPIGVAGLITPWNCPMNQVTLKVVPALLAGCTVVLKPSEIAPLSFRRMAERFGHVGPLREAMIADARLPADCRHMLLVKLGEALKGAPLVAALMGPARAERMLKDACVKASLTLIDATSAEDHAALIAHLRVRGDLTASFLVRAVAHGKVDFFGSALVALAGQSGERVRALLVVGGDDPRPFRAQAAALGVGDRIVFTGHSPVVEEYFQAGDVFVFPTIYEAFGLVMLEAAAAGLPVVATPLGVAEEMIENGRNGALIERDGASIAAAVAPLVADREGRALTTLRPCGHVEVDGRRYDGLAEEGFIPEGATVRVVRSRSGQLVVRASRRTAEAVLPTEHTASLIEESP